MVRRPLASEIEAQLPRGGKLDLDAPPRGRPTRFAVEVVVEPEGGVALRVTVGGD
jgi:hypothetical protein